MSEAARRAARDVPTRKRNRPVDADERARIIEAIKGGGTCAQVARDFDRGTSTVSRIAKAEGLAFDRSKTKKATEARQIDNAASRTRLATAMLDRAHLMVEALPDTIPVFTAADARSVAIAAKVLSQGAIEAEQANRGDPNEARSAVDQWLDWMKAGGSREASTTKLKVVTDEDDVA